MADSPSLNKTHIPSSSSAPTKPPNSKSLFNNYFFSKSLMIILVILVFLYFPSQVPEIFKETVIISKFWDLIYLLVIGIAVSYGLLSRKIDSVHVSDGNIGDDETYLSGVSQFSSIFEDGSHGIRNSYGFEGSKIGDLKKVNQYPVGESLVVTDDEKYVVERLGRQNLGSKSLDSALGKSVVGDSDSDSGSGSRNWFKQSKNGKFRGLVPVKLEDKFKESGSYSDSGSDSDSDSRTRLKRRSKSMRLDKRGDMLNAEVNETLEGVKSQSVRFGMPSKVKSLSEKEEPIGVETVEVHHRYRKPDMNGETSFVESKVLESSTGGFFEMNSHLSAAEGLKDFIATLDGSSEESAKDLDQTKVDDGTFEIKNNKQFVRSKSQSSSIGASSDTLRNMLRKEEKSDVSNPIPKPAANANTYKRGKSVRTNRSKEPVLESKVNTFQSQTDAVKVETQSKLGGDGMDVKADEWSDTEPHSGEVDRKAEEFIAKFREQIRLQKVASARKLNLL